MKKKPIIRVLTLKKIELPLPPITYRKMTIIIILFYFMLLGYNVNILLKLI